MTKPLRIVAAWFAATACVSIFSGVAQAQTSTSNGPTNDATAPTSPLPKNVNPDTIHAPDPVKIAPTSSGFSGNTVYVGGTPILKVLFSSAGMTPQERAGRIQQRVDALLDHSPVKPDDIYVQDYDAIDTGVYVRGHLLFMADSRTAKANNMSAHDLAESWASKMRHVLPSLTKDQAAVPDDDASPGR